MRIYVKYMVGASCVEKIENELIKLGIIISEINQGIVEFQEELDGVQLLQLNETFQELGFEVVDSDTSKLLDHISELVKMLIYKNPGMTVCDYQNYMEEELSFNGSNIMKVFSQVHGIDLAQFAIIQQVERIKEMLLYEDREATEIAEIFDFKDEIQLTKTFQSVTGLTPEYYIEIRNKRREIKKKADSDEQQTRAIKEVN